MFSALTDWLVNSNLVPHGVCLSWDPSLIVTYAVSDTLIALAYFSIPLALAVVAHKRSDLIFRPVLLLFAAFILLCGTTHWLDVFTLWVPLYDLQAFVKGLTALASIGTAIVLWYYLPQFLLLPSASQMREANAQLLASRTELAQAQKMEAVGQLTGGIAHDFNNLLQVIVGSLELMERRVAQGRVADTVRYIGAIRQASDTASRLTNRLLAFARRQTLQPQAVEIDRLLADMADLLARSLGPLITLDIRPNDGLWTVYCDPAQLESSILNLAINARDAMPKGGRLTIATSDRVLSVDDVAHEDVDPGNYVQIDICDEGAGISEDVLARVFEPFFTTKPSGEGTGLGLSQVYGFAKQSGGFIKIDSTVGRGTTVRLLLPGHDKQATSQALEATPMASPRGLQDRRILLVEDRDDVRTQIIEALSEAECKLTAFANAGEALAQLPQEQFDLLVTDIGLTGTDGRDLAKAARQIVPGLPVLLITGYAGKSAESVGIDDDFEVLRKPFSSTELVNRMQLLLSKRRKNAVKNTRTDPSSN